MTKLKYLTGHDVIDTMSMKPFEGVFGDTPEARLIEHFLAMPDFTFSVNQLLEQVRVSRPTLMRKLRLFVEWGVIREVRTVRPMVFQLNADSDIVLAIELFNYALIDRIVPGEDLFVSVGRKMFPPDKPIELDNLPGRDGENLPSMRVILDRASARRFAEALEDLIEKGIEEGTVGTA